MEDNTLDAFVCPSAVGEADKGLSFTGSTVMNLPWTHAGLPVISLPMGRGPQGLPLGLQLAGRFGHDAELLALAGALAPHLDRFALCSQLGPYQHLPGKDSS
jgi:Asp-tRNA(Asn)/Glu-tRNA(Gln) amidotransferase A subunit family amidase